MSEFYRPSQPDLKRSPERLTSVASIRQDGIGVVTRAAYFSRGVDVKVTHGKGERYPEDPSTLIPDGFAHVEIQSDSDPEKRRFEEMVKIINGGLERVLIVPKNNPK